MDCCGKPLDQMGLQRRNEKTIHNLVDKMAGLEVKRLIVACPGCYYHLQEVLEQHGVELLTVYEVLDFLEFDANQAVPLCTVHDSCPDRFDGIFATQVREALCQCGYNLVEMSSNGIDSPCCGSGGQVSNFRPEYTEKLVGERLKDAEKSGADILVAYCLSCVLNFATSSSYLKVRHALNLLLGIEERYTGVKDRVLKMYE